MKARPRWIESAIKAAASESASQTLLRARKQVSRPITFKPIVLNEVRAEA